MTVRIPKKKSKNPPYFSHDFVITNHGDIVSFVAMIIVMGLIYKGTNKFSSRFLFVQHNATDEHIPHVLYSPGLNDFCMIFFYTLIWIVSHAVLQEYVLDKYAKKLDLFKVRLAKFHESAHLTIFFAISIFWAIYNIINENLITNFSSLWEDYPQRMLPYWTKLYFIFQICYWLHDYPELYFQRVKKELIMTRILHATLYLLSISLAYVGGLSKLCMVLLTLHYATDIFFHIARALHFAGYRTIAYVGFTIWNIIFIPTRMASTILTFLTLNYGLGKHGVDLVDLASGNFNTTRLRYTAMAFIFLLQAFMVWNFIIFHQRHRHEKVKSKPGSFHEPGAAKRKEKKRGKRDEEETSDVGDSDQSNHNRELRRRKQIKS